MFEGPNIEFNIEPFEEKRIISKNFLKNKNLLTKFKIRIFSYKLSINKELTEWTNPSHNMNFEEHYSIGNLYTFF
jgi:hypothetical protein